MKRMILWVALAGALLLLLGACSTRSIEMYTLSGASNTPRVAQPRFGSIRVDYPKGIEDTMGTRIYFSRTDLTQSYYRYSQWSKPLNRILMANLIEALQRSALARVVLDYSSEASAQYELESTIYRFEHRMMKEGSFADVSIGLRLLRSSDKRIVASKRFDYSIPCRTTDAAGFVEAANRALSQLSSEMVRWLRSR